MILQRPVVNCCTAQQKVPHGHAAKETTGFCSVVGTGLLVIFFAGFAWSHIGIAMIVFIGRKKNRLVLFKNKYMCPLQTLICTCPNTNRFYRPSLNKNMWMILQRPATICCDALPPPHEHVTVALAMVVCAMLATPCCIAQSCKQHTKTSEVDLPSHFSSLGSFCPWSSADGSKNRNTQQWDRNGPMTRWVQNTPNTKDVQTKIETCLGRCLWLVHQRP